MLLEKNGFNYWVIDKIFSKFIIMYKVSVYERSKAFVAYIVSKLSPKFFFIIAYVHNRKRVPHFKHPRDLSEIWIKSILDGKPREMYWLADKYRVREFVKERGLADILVPLMGRLSENP